jgi:hypothetical protein
MQGGNAAPNDKQQRYGTALPVPSILVDDTR